jgi:hypothetical protein
MVERLLHIHYHGWALLAVLPTVTPIARQALFAGQLPLYFPDTWAAHGPGWPALAALLAGPGAAT